MLKHFPGLPALLCLVAAAAFGQGSPPVAGTSVNMVSGTQFPGGDPFLQRQNEPSMGVSSRNSLHLLAGANDYRTVDLPGLPGGEPTGDAWLGLFKSFDGGKTWQSTLVPGYPQDTSPEGVASPLHGFQAAADPVVRPGTNGLFFYSGIAFNRTGTGANPRSSVFVARYIDDNNLEGADTLRYLGTSTVHAGLPGHFEDKPFIAVDVPRAGAKTCVVPATPAQSFPAGKIYIAWTQFNGPKANGDGEIQFSSSGDCGKTWSDMQRISGPQFTNQGAAIAIDPNTGAVYVVWRVFANATRNNVDAIMFTASYDGGDDWTVPRQIAAMSPFDQGTTGVSFRTNAYPAIAVDAGGRVYVTWAQRGVLPSGDARIVVTSRVPAASNDEETRILGKWPAPTAVDAYAGRGHQFMPAMAFSSGKLSIAWYDLRNDDEITVYSPLGGGQYGPSLLADGTVVWGPFIQDPAAPYQASSRRNTLDVRLAQAPPGYPVVFGPSIQVSQYEFGTPANAPPSNIQQLQVNPPNLPMFQQGSVPFFGDYIDIAGPTFLPKPDRTWRYNNLPIDPDNTHVVWTDNRNVVQPADGDWTHYTPVGATQPSTSVFDPAQQRPACAVGQAGMRNQDIFSATVSPILVTAKSNAKALSTTLQREFPVTVENTTTQTRYYRLTISLQPAGGKASFLQFPATGLPDPLTSIDVQIPALSSTARSVFIKSTDPHAVVPVNVVEILAPNAGTVPNGLQGSVTLNSDFSNPNISNPNISNTEVYNPNISNPNISNPNISNPNISNPNISNPNISNPNISNAVVANPNISNPNISNPNISNPNISNPNISNPNISNPNISNTALTDVTWNVTNTGNTAASYSLKLLKSQAPPSGVVVQLIVSKSYTTPVEQGCNVAVQTHYYPIANITNVAFTDPQKLADPTANDPFSPNVSLSPGETVLVTIRSLDTTTSNPQTALQRYNPAQTGTPVAVAPAPAIPNGPPAPPTLSLVILTVSLPPATVSGAYTQPLLATGGTPPYSWSIAGGNSAGLAITGTGVLQGTPLTAFPLGATFTVMLTDGTGNSTSRTLTLTVNPAPSLVTLSLPGGDQSVPYAPQTLLATGGTPPLGAWSLTAGSLPAGLTLNPLTGSISGTLAANAVTSIFNVRIADANNVAAAGQFTIVVNPLPSLTGGTLPDAVFGLPYTYAIPVNNGTAPFVLSLIGSLPPGLTLANGVINGSATSHGLFPFSVMVTDAAGGISTANFAIRSVIFGFTGPYQMQNWSANASNGGSTTISPPSGPSTSPSFGYSINFGNPGPGVPFRTWTFPAIAAGSGTVTFDWHYTGFHAYFAVNAILQVFAVGPTGTTTITLYQPAQQDCCVSPSNGFDVQGTNASIAVTQGFAYGFIVGGSNGDLNSQLNGTLTISNFSAK